MLIAVLLMKAKSWKQSKCPSPGKWINKWILLRESTTDPTYNMDKFLKHYAKWRKPYVKDNILFDSIYMKF